MTLIFEILSRINELFSKIIWSYLGLWLLVSAGILSNFFTDFFQIKYMGVWLKFATKNIFAKKQIKRKGEKGISPFQALCTALAATVGTGNIAGVAAAITIGGAGSIFWMWIAAFTGMAISYCENILGIYYRKKNSNGQWCGGAMYYLSNGLISKKQKRVGKMLSVIFSLFTVFASLCMGNMVQVNKIVGGIESVFKIQRLSSIKLFDDISLYALVLGIIVTFLVAIVVLGGLNRLAGVAEKLVPFMIIMFLIGSFIVITVKHKNIDDAFKAIFVTAFRPHAAAGGGGGYILGTVITQGFKRGMFTNEAGLGSSPIINSSANVKEPVHQGMLGIFGVFIDTVILCTVTALVILTSPLFDLKSGTVVSSYNDATLVAAAFNCVFRVGNFGEKFVAFSMFLFAFATILGWSHYGEKAAQYLWRQKGVMVYRTVFVLTTMVGALINSSAAWDISDTFNGLMMLPNLIGIIILLPQVKKINDNYILRKIKGKQVLPLLSFYDYIQSEFEIEVLKE